MPEEAALIDCTAQASYQPTTLQLSSELMISLAVQLIVSSLQRAHHPDLPRSELVSISVSPPRALHGTKQGKFNDKGMHSNEGHAKMVVVVDARKAQRRQESDEPPVKPRHSLLKPTWQSPAQPLFRELTKPLNKRDSAPLRQTNSNSSRDHALSKRYLSFRYSQSQKQLLLVRACPVC